MNLVIQCAWCRRVKCGTASSVCGSPSPAVPAAGPPPGEGVEVGDGYVSASPVPWAEVSHGICPDCLAKQFPQPVETPFAALAVGERFRILTPKGALAGSYIKTGDDSYGYRDGDPLWSVHDQQFPTVRQAATMATQMRAHAA